MSEYASPGLIVHPLVISCAVGEQKNAFIDSEVGWETRAGPGRLLNQRELRHRPVIQLLRVRHAKLSMPRTVSIILPSLT